MGDGEVGTHAASQRVAPKLRQRSDFFQHAPNDVFFNFIRNVSDCDRQTMRISETESQ